MTLIPAERRKRWRFCGPVSLSEIFLRSKENSNGCIEWIGSRDRCGYGLIIRQRKRYVVTRLVMHLVNNFDLSSSLCVLHKCDNPSCVNPDHLFLGTKKDNSLDAYKKGRRKHKLSAETVQSLRQEYAKGTTYKKLAVMFDINTQTVWSIVRRRSWKHIFTGRVSWR